MTGGIIGFVVVLLALLPAPTALAQSVPRLGVAPFCVAPGIAARIVILGEGWGPGPVNLFQSTGASIGSVTPGTSPARGQAGAFSFSTTITADGSFEIIATQGNAVARTFLRVLSDCPPLPLSVTLSCRTVPGALQVSGTGFDPGLEVQVDIDPFGNAETLPQVTLASGTGSFAANFDVRRLTGATVPVVATQPSGLSPAAAGKRRAVAFFKLDPCSPPPTPPTVGTNPPKSGTTSSTTTTTTATIGVPPLVPPATVPTPGARALATISPTTVRPGRCAVVVISAAPATTPVVARFADRPSVGGQTGPTGLAVLSLCEPHNSGAPLGSVKVLIGIGPGPPVPVFDELRVPRRPEPPLLQSGADIRRS